MGEEAREHHSRSQNKFSLRTTEQKERAAEVVARNPKESRKGLIRQLVDWLDGKVGEQPETPYDSDMEKTIRSTPLHSREQSPVVVFRGNKTELKVAGGSSPTNIQESTKYI